LINHPNPKPVKISVNPVDYPDAQSPGFSQIPIVLYKRPVGADPPCMAAIASVRRSAASWLFRLFVVLPGAIYLGLPVLFISTVVTVVLASAVHPLFALLIPLAEGLAITFTYQLQESSPLSIRTRCILLAFAAGLIVLALLLLDAFEGCRVNCDGNDKARWLYLGPLLAVISTAALAGVTANRRAGLAFLAVTLAILANGGLFLLLWALLALYLWRVPL
jgi:hypothetical protein